MHPLHPMSPSHPAHGAPTPAHPEVPRWESNPVEQPGVGGSELLLSQSQGNSVPGFRPDPPLRDELGPSRSAAVPRGLFCSSRGPEARQEQPRGHFHTVTARCRSPGASRILPEHPPHGSRQGFPGICAAPLQRGSPQCPVPSLEFPHPRRIPIPGVSSLQDLLHPIQDHPHPEPRGILFQQHPHPRSVSIPGASSSSRIRDGGPAPSQEHPDPRSIPMPAGSLFIAPSPSQEHPIPRGILSRERPIPRIIPIPERPYPGAIPHSPRSHL